MTFVKAYPESKEEQFFFFRNTLFIIIIILIYNLLCLLHNTYISIRAIIFVICLNIRKIEFMEIRLGKTICFTRTLIPLQLSKLSIVWTVIILFLNPVIHDLHKNKF